MTGQDHTITGSEKAIRTVALASMIVHVTDVNKLNGWHDEARTFGEDIALLHSEVSEALEGFRKHDMENVKEELVDVLIRLFDTWYRMGFTAHDLIETFDAKMEKNAKRGFRHGGKAL